jgi:16S rRNA (adenine1518-N6/adenine1519-N6)-dimethyltransferase
LHNLPPIKDILKSYNISADKRLGQNFLFDGNLTDRIARCSGSLEGKTVIEIGAGPGLLTRSILAAGAEFVTAIEKDQRCFEALNDYLVPQSNKRLTVINEDALKGEIYDKIEGKVKIIANLPYNISTELLFLWLEKIDKFESLTLMFQKEVAMRIMAKPKSKEYGKLSIKAQLLCEIEHEFDIPPSAFFPPPKVTSTVITLVPRKKPLAEVNWQTLDKICKATFGQRRKTLRSSLKQLCKNPSELLSSANIEENRRPEELSIEEFCALACQLDRLYSVPPL